MILRIIHIIHLPKYIYAMVERYPSSSYCAATTTFSNIPSVESYDGVGIDPPVILVEGPWGQPVALTPNHYHEIWSTDRSCVEYRPSKVVPSLDKQLCEPWFSTKVCRAGRPTRLIFKGKTLSSQHNSNTTWKSGPFNINWRLQLYEKH